jgi:holliday junction DNA helicase RuvA
MIAYLSGSFSYKSPALVYVDINGVGYEVHITLNTYSEIQHMEKGTLYTHLQIKEDGHTLYGFSNTAEKAMFVKLIGINDITRAIVQNNTRLLESIKGIGKKTAERIVLELKDKMNKNDGTNLNSSLIYNTLEQDALNALLALGIARQPAENALKKVVNSEENQNLEHLIKKALQSI